MKKAANKVFVQNKHHSGTIIKVKPKQSSIEKFGLNEIDSDIFHSVRPFYLFLLPFGLQKTILNSPGWIFNISKLFTLLLATTLIGIQSYFIYKKCIGEYTTFSPANIVTDLLNIVPWTFTTVVSLIMSTTCNQRMIPRILKNFNIIDHQLYIDNQEIYGTLRMKIITTMSVIVLFLVIHFTYDYFVSISLFRMIISHTLSIIKELVMLEVTMLLYIIGNRMGVMNDQVEGTRYNIVKLLDEEVSKALKRKHSKMLTYGSSIGSEFIDKNFENNEEDIDELTRLMRVYDRLIDNANIINSCFGISLLSAATSVFIHILWTVNALINVTYTNARNKDMYVGSLVVWCMRDLFYVCLVTFVVERIQSKIKTTTNIINKLSISTDIDPRQEELLERFSELIDCRRTTITACNFFPFDFTFIYSLVGAVATYTVILLQVNQPGAKTKP